jgi:hypothetical protein
MANQNILIIVSATNGGVKVLTSLNRYSWFCNNLQFGYITETLCFLRERKIQNE